ncbi:(2Fe-2S)-binding protein [Paenibacillus methanolicus]|uniref:Sarcosine oxidase subunit alpha n=1 Tax=Paenibacillus methanolicus TaxID=582686 RepID=A0A5S5CGL6_9BACL|nr:(2Fe-2S)-binding protein [Paenibacillus methanolicus]TYP78910.1 sarcosine oxidase subunit alpha [Paenibacillus methanolicus]
MERIQHHPILGKTKFHQPITYTFNGKKLSGYRGEPIAAALLAEGIRVLRRHEESGAARGFYCAIGHCMECRLVVQGQGIVRSCLTPLEPGMIITEGQQLANEITGRKLP